MNIRKIDAFCHLIPKPYFDRLFELPTTPQSANMRGRIAKVPSLVDLDIRFQQMDEFGDYRQIINISVPPVEDLGPPEVSRELARMGNEAMAGLVEKYPDRFAGFTACLPMNDPDAAVDELTYAVRDLGAVGAQIYTHVDGVPMDDPRFEGVYQKSAELGRVLQVHPCRNATWSDYPTEARSKFEIWWTFGWEYDLSAFMARVVFGGVLERNPTLKLLIHHGGSMVPHFSGRVGPGWDQMGSRTPPADVADIDGWPLTKRPIDYFRMMYADTAMFGAAHALRCSIDFYGVDQMLFASDSPFDPEKGPGFIRATIQNMESIGLSEHDKEKIYLLNACRIFGISPP